MNEEESVSHYRNYFYYNSCSCDLVLIFISPKVKIPKVKVQMLWNSAVYGLDEPMQFEPGKYYDFSVVGAGEDNDNPKEGDMKWVPKYWSMVKNPLMKKKTTSWKIGTDKSISESNTYNLYVFFRKYL